MLNRDCPILGRDAHASKRLQERDHVVVLVIGQADGKALIIEIDDRIQVRS
jgi:hypothetical protein